MKRRSEREGWATLASRVVLYPGLSLAIVASQHTAAAPGQVDPSFNGNGMAVADFSSPDDQAFGVAIQNDGKIVVVGHFSNLGNINFAVLRYLANGTPDTSFNGSGRATTPIGPGSDHARAVAIQPDGKILVAGYASDGSNDDFALVRYLPNGTLDTDFNTTGIVTTPVGTERDRALCLAIQGDGKILLAGLAGNSGGADHDFALVRYHPDGSLDTDFDTDGKVITPIGTGFDEIHAMVLQADGRIVVAGRSSNSLNMDFALARYLTDGTHDTTFNGIGKTTIAMGSGSDEAYGLALQPDGKILVTGFVSGNGNVDLGIARLHPGGFLDTTFNGNGKVVKNLNGLTLFQGSSESPRAIVRQPDGKILVVCQYIVNGGRDVAVARFHANGMIDPTFAGKGYAVANFGSLFDEPQAMALQADGRIVVAGYLTTSGSSDMVTMRFRNAQGDSRAGANTLVPIGNNLYNLTAVGQTLATGIRAGGGVATVYAGIDNDGPVTDQFRFRGTPPNPALGVRYFRGTTNVTTAVALGSYNTGPTGPRVVHVLRLRLTAVSRVRNLRHSLIGTSTSTRDASAIDRVRFLAITR